MEDFSSVLSSNSSAELDSLSEVEGDRSEQEVAVTGSSISGRVTRVKSGLDRHHHCDRSSQSGEGREDNSGSSLSSDGSTEEQWD